MLQLILGRAGSGKTYYAREYFGRGEAENAKGKQILIVPEQYSFEAEKAILRRFGASRANEISAVSFSRLTEWFFRTHGGLAGERLSDGGRAILMEIAAMQVMDHLEIYAGAASRGELSGILLSVLSEMKRSALSSQDLENYAQQLAGGELSRKLSEIALIFAAYEALVGQGYADPQDDLTKMAQMAQETDFFSDARIMIDSFGTFSAQELLLIRVMLRSAREVAVTFCTDGQEDREAGFGRFSSTKRTIAQIMRIAHEENVRIAEPVRLEGAPRFGNGELRALEEGLFGDSGALYEEEPQSVSVFRAEDLYEEAEYVASEIRRLVMSEGYRYREIAVFSRTPEKYLGILDTALEKREIPFFMDRPQEVERKPLCRLITSALQILQGGYDANHVFTYLKTGLAGLAEDEIFLLENYTFIWNITGKKWLSPFTENPGGFSAAEDQETRDLLARINELRRKVTEPLEHLRAALKDADGRAAAQAVYGFLEELSVSESVSALCDRLMEQGEREQEMLLLRLWDLVMADLDQIAATAAGTRMDLAMLLRVFETLFSVNRLAEIPQRADQVSVCAAQRSRPEGIRAVFLIGAVRGEFPMTPSPEGLFSDRERRTLIEIGMPIGRTFEEETSWELLLAYEAACSAGDRVYFSFPKDSASFESELVISARSVFPKLRVTERADYPDTFFASAKDAAFSLAARRWRENSPQAQAIREIFENEKEYRGKVEAIEHAVDSRPLAIESPEIAASLFGGEHRLSATQVETFHLCRFRYFCEYGLHARKIEPAKIDALQYGSLMHHILEKLFLHHDSSRILEMSEEDLRAKIGELCREYADLNYGDLNEKGKRFRSAISRLGDSAYYLIRHIAGELSQSMFRPESFELPVGDRDLPVSFTAENGRVVRLVGKIDRVDSYRKDGTTYLRVIDYKTGTKEFRYSDLLYGLNLQMMIYLGALIENRRGKAAGVLYMPSIRPLVSVERSADDGEAQEKIEREFQMKGVVLNNRDVLSAMEEKLEARYIPYGVSKGRTTGKDYLLTEEDFDLIHRLIGKKISDMQLALDAGDIEAQPLMQNRFGCDYCPYFAVCGRLYDRDEAKRARGSKKDVFEKIKEELS